MASKTAKIFNWNVHREGAVEHRKEAIKNELGKSWNLIFLQEIPFRPDGEVGAECLPLSSGYEVKYTPDSSQGHYNGILYKESEFSEQQEYRKYLSEAYYLVQMKLDCFTAHQEGKTEEEIVAYLSGKYTKENMTNAVQNIQNIAEDFEHVRISSYIQQVSAAIKKDNISCKWSILKDCCSGREDSDFWDMTLKDLSYCFALAFLQPKSGPSLQVAHCTQVAVSFHNCSPTAEPEKMLHVFLYLLAQLRWLLKERHPDSKFPILLAGDFNMDVFYHWMDQKGEPCHAFRDYLLKHFKPKPYLLTACRKDRIDHIMLWKDDGDVKCTLGSIQTHLIDAPPGYDKLDPTINYRLRVPGFEKMEDWREVAKRIAFQKEISNHDPLTTTLTITYPSRCILQ